MRSLKFGYDEQNIQCITNAFLHLEELQIWNVTDGASVSEVLRLNPHLQKIHLYGDDATFWQSANEYLRSLRILKIYCKQGFFAPEDCSAHFRSVEDICIHFGDEHPFPKIPFTFDRLEKLEMRIDKFQLNDNFKPVLGIF